MKSLSWGYVSFKICLAFSERQRDKWTRYRGVGLTKGIQNKVYGEGFEVDKKVNLWYPAINSVRIPNNGVGWQNKRHSDCEAWEKVGLEVHWDGDCAPEWSTTSCIYNYSSYTGLQVSCLCSLFLSLTSPDHTAYYLAAHSLSCIERAGCIALLSAVNLKQMKQLRL